MKATPPADGLSWTLRVSTNCPQFYPVVLGSMGAFGGGDQAFSRPSTIFYPMALPKRPRVKPQKTMDGIIWKQVLEKRHKTSGLLLMGSKDSTSPSRTTRTQTRCCCQSQPTQDEQNGHRNISKTKLWGYSCLMLFKTLLTRPDRPSTSNT